MNQQIAVNKAYIEMAKRNLCAPIIEHEIKFYLKLMFAIGYNQGRYQQSNMRAVIKLNKAGERKSRYDSIDAARRATGIPKQAICNVLAGRANTAGKHHWMYEE